MARIFIAALDDDDADQFAQRIISGDFPIYGYPDLIERLKAGYIAVTDARSAEDAGATGMFDFLYTPKFSGGPLAGKILDIIEKNRVQ